MGILSCSEDASGIFSSRRIPGVSPGCGNVRECQLIYGTNMVNIWGVRDACHSVGSGDIIGAISLSHGVKQWEIVF